MASRPAHLVRRFAGSLRPGGPSPSEVHWARGVLLPDELEIWSSLPGPDRRHSAAVARRVASDLGDDATRPVLAAALLHDAGKLDAGLGTFGRVLATVVATLVGREVAARWSDRTGILGRIGRYVQHPERGAAMLEAAGSDPLTTAWTAEHHLPEARWTLPPHLATALRDADDD